jgi:hypothetical protein
VTLTFPALPCGIPVTVTFPAESILAAPTEEVTAQLKLLSKFVTENVKTPSAVIFPENVGTSPEL